MRTTLCGESLLAFCELYLPHRFGLPWNRMHEELSADLVRDTSEGPLRLAVGAPDGYGKSALVSHAFVLWTLAIKRHRCIVIGSSSRSAAGEHLAGIDSELRSNAKLVRDFPHLKQIARTSGASGSRASPPRQIAVPGIAKVQCIGPTSQLTQVNFEGQRPDLFILDEFDQSGRDAASRSGDRIEQSLERRILHRFTESLVVVLGTVHEHGCLIDRLLDPGRSRVWTQRFYKAVEACPENFDLWFEWAALWNSSESDAARFLEEHRSTLLEGARVLWPEHEVFERLMRLRAEHGWDWFDRYRQGLPPEGCRRAGTRQAIVFGSNLAGEEFTTVDDAGYKRTLGREGDRLRPKITMLLGDTDRRLPPAAARSGLF